MREGGDERKLQKKNAYYELPFIKFCEWKRVSLASPPPGKGPVTHTGGAKTVA